MSSWGAPNGHTREARTAEAPQAQEGLFEEVPMDRCEKDLVRASKFYSSRRCAVIVGPSQAKPSSQSDLGRFGHRTDTWICCPGAGKKQ